MGEMVNFTVLSLMIYFHQSHHKKVKRQATEWENISTIYI